MNRHRFPCTVSPPVISIPAPLSASAASSSCARWICVISRSVLGLRGSRHAFDPLHQETPHGDRSPRCFVGGAGAFCPAGGLVCESAANRTEEVRHFHQRANAPHVPGGGA